MDNKTIMIIVAVAVVVIAIVAAVALSNGGSPDDDKYVYYYGNGGTSPEGDTFKTTETVVLGNNLFTKEGSNCIGYNDKKDGSGTSYTEGANVMPGTKLYAQWESASITKLTVQSKNMFPDHVNFTLEPAGIDINNYGEYTLTEGAKIYISPVKAGLVSISDNVISFYEEGKTYSVIPSMTNGSIAGITVSGSSAVLTFTYAVGTNPVFSYIMAESS
jgi:hypothetical protein